MARRCARASLRWTMFPDAPSRRSKASTRTATTRCKKPGATRACRSAATARAGRSCRPRLCSPRSRTPQTRTSKTPWPAISVVAAPISAFVPPSRRQPRGRDMTTIIENVSRRKLIQGVAALGGFVIAVRLLPIRHAFAQQQKYGADGMPNGTVNDPRAFVSIDKDGLVSIICARSEMGQGVRTGVPLILADEMEADWSRVRIVQAPGDEKKFGNQDTDGSRSTRHFLKPMRECGAAARMMLEAAAAKRWNVAVGEVEARNHEVVHKASGRKLGYGELAAEAAALPVPAPDKLKLKDPAAFRYMGKDTPIVDLVDMTTGRAKYGQDTVLPGMKFAVIARSPVHGGKVASVDSAAAMKVPGVEKVVQIEGTPSPAKFQPAAGVAVIARNTWAAMKGREALKITWDDGPNKVYESRSYRKKLEETARQAGKVVRNEGDAEGALAKAAKK